MVVFVTGMQSIILFLFIKLNLSEVEQLIQYSYLERQIILIVVNNLCIITLNEKACVPDVYRPPEGIKTLDNQI